MRERYLKRITEYDAAAEERLAAQLGLDAAAKFLLRKFGVTEDNLHDFFPAGENKLTDPFLMDDMRAAAEKISDVMRKCGKILIFGDYDADGISAAAILYNYLTDSGADASVYIPKRVDGYGLNNESLREIFSNNFYDLVVTVDCGITGADEVRFLINELGTDVIVTDHHELCGALPDCLCINPKRGYPTRDLSGSAVALKLVQALSDETTAEKYCDLASIGIIGDLMPLVGENRVIVRKGLSNINNAGIKALLKAHGIETAVCSDFSLKICPKLNAAGRVGNPRTAWELLVCDDEKHARLLASNLFETNDTRRQLTEETFIQALAQIAEKGMPTDKAIFVCNENWQHGMLGIVCNRLVEKFCVPAGVFTVENGKIVGSMRTVNGCDLYSAVSAVSEHVIKFGGHKASVGVTIAKEKFADFCEAFWRHTCGEKYADASLQYYDEEFCQFHLTDKFFNQLKSFEPCMPNDKIILKGTFSAKNANLFGKDKNHLYIVTDDGVDIKGFFKYSHFLPALRTGCRFACLVSLIKDDFNGKPTLILEDMMLLPSLKMESLYLKHYLNRINFSAESPKKFISAQKCRELLDGKKTCFVFNSLNEFEASELCADLQDCYLDFFRPVYRCNTVLIAPEKTADFLAYDSVVCCGRYFAEIAENISHSNLYYFNNNVAAPSYLTELQITRADCALIYTALNRGGSKFLSLQEAYDALGLFAVPFGKFCAIVRIFEEIGILNVDDYPFTMRINGDVKSDLKKSRLYQLAALPE